MLVNLEKQADGIELIAVLMKSIQLPRGLASSIEQNLTDEIIKLRSIEAFNKLSQSNNSKVIITDGETPLLINQ